MNPSFDEVEKDFLSIRGKKLEKVNEYFDADDGRFITTTVEKYDRTLIDRGKFFKMFHKSEEKFMGLSYPGMKLLGYISYRLKDGEDQVYLDPTEVCKVCKWKSKSLFYKALKDLNVNQFLFPHSRPMHHYINASYFFNGVRTKLVRYKFSNPMIVDGVKIRKMTTLEVEEPVGEINAEES